MIPKTLKDKIIALKLTWNFKKWQDVVLAYVSNYRGLSRSAKSLVQAVESGASNTTILERATRLKVALEYTDKAIEKANEP
jgi:hypothetical protein